MSARERHPPLSLNAWLRWDVVSRLLGSIDGIHSVLEIGAGVGGMAVRLAQRYDYVGVEPDPTSFAVAKSRLDRAGRGIMLPGEVSAIGTSRRFDALCAFEVLEHIEDDVDALKEWKAQIRGHGWLLMSVPAGQRRFGRADELAGHFRRYDRAQLEAVLKQAGFKEVEVYGYGFPLGYLLQATWNLSAWRRSRASIADRTAASGRRFQPPDELASVTALASAPFRLLQRPFSKTDIATGWVAFARRDS